MKFPRRFDFVALTVGSVIPDLLEPVFMIAFPGAYWAHREWSHSLVGAVTYDLAVALATTIVIARPLLGWLDRVRPSPLWSRFGGVDFRVGRIGLWTVASAAIGTLSHILIDIPFHTVMPLFFPAASTRLYPEEFGRFTGAASALVFGPAFGFLLYRYWWRPARAPKGTRGETLG
jgi:membrane-bound metal-dependent hydrolase YbcI (DUF457 family)